MKLIDLLPIWCWPLHSTIIPEVTNDIFIGMAGNQYRQALSIDLRKTFGLENHQLWLFKADSIGLGRTKRKLASTVFFNSFKPQKDTKLNIRPLKE